MSSSGRVVEGKKEKKEKKDKRSERASSPSARRKEKEPAVDLQSEVARVSPGSSPAQTDQQANAHPSSGASPAPQLLSVIHSPAPDQQASAAAPRSGTSASPRLLNVAVRGSDGEREFQILSSEDAAGQPQMQVHPLPPTEPVRRPAADGASSPRMIRAALAQSPVSTITTTSILVPAARLNLGGYLGWKTEAVDVDPNDVASIRKATKKLYERGSAAEMSAMSNTNWRNGIYKLLGGLAALFTAIVFIVDVNKGESDTAPTPLNTSDRVVDYFLLGIAGLLVIFFQQMANQAKSMAKTVEESARALGLTPDQFMAPAYSAGVENHGVFMVPKKNKVKVVILDETVAARQAGQPAQVMTAGKIWQKLTKSLTSTTSSFSNVIAGYVEPSAVFVAGLVEFAIKGALDSYYKISSSDQYNLNMWLDIANLIILFGAAALQYFASNQSQATEQMVKSIKFQLRKLYVLVRQTEVELGLAVPAAGRAVPAAAGRNSHFAPPPAVGNGRVAPAAGNDRAEPAAANGSSLTLRRQGQQP